MPDVLPIETIRGDFVEQLGQGKPVVVVAPTGSGKSTCLPLWMAEQVEGTVLVVEPRRVACRSLAGYLAQQSGGTVGESVGYRIRFADKSGPDTRILFVTPGVALRLVGDEDTFPFSAVMLDEFHERGWEVDLFLTVLRRRAAQQGGWSRPLVVTSATIEAEALASTLEGVCLEAEGRTFPVSVTYTEAEPAPTSHGLDHRVASAVRQAVASESEPSGDILVFLPGKREIAACERALARWARPAHLDVVQVHGALPTEQIAEALAEHTGNRRVFLATNVAETSLTIPSVTTVIDSGLVRARAHRAGRSSLVLAEASQASMDQRAGRAGRVAPGRCLRLWSRQFRPDPSTAPEITRIELDDVLLHAARCGLTGGELDTIPWPTPPPAFAVEPALARLRELGALDPAGAMTKLGGRLLRLPVSLHEARVLVNPPEHLRATLADLVGLLQSRGSLLLSLSHLDGGHRGQVAAARDLLLESCPDEVYANLICVRRGRSRQHFLHDSGLHEARRLSTALRQLLECPNVDPIRDPDPFPDRGELTGFLLSRWPEAGFVLRERAKRSERGAPGGSRPPKAEPWANGEAELSVFPYSGWSDDRETDGAWPLAGLILDHEWIGAKGTGVTGFGRLLLPCTYEQLAAAGLGHDEIRSARHERDEAGGVRLVAKVERVHAGVVLESFERPLTGDRLRQAAAGMVMRGQLLRGAAEAVLDDFHLASLILHWPHHSSPASRKPETGVFEDAEAFVKARLAQLGVEESEDLALVDAEDLRVDVPDLFGMRPDEVAELREEFPRNWLFQGAVYGCEVDPVARLVVLAPANGTAKKQKEPPAWALPRFQRFSVKSRVGSRMLTLR